MRAWLALLRADLRLVGRSPRGLFAMVLFGLTVLLVFHFSLPAASSRSIPLGGSALWLSLLFSGVLGIPPLQHRPETRRLLPQLFTSELSCVGYFWEKWMMGFLQMVVSALVLFPVTVVLFNFPFRARLAGAGLDILLGLVGLSVVMTLVTSLSVDQEPWLVPVLVFPLLLPVVLAGTRLVAGRVSSQVPYPMTWLHLLIGYDLVMVFGSWLLAEFLWTELPGR